MACANESFEVSDKFGSALLAAAGSWCVYDFAALRLGYRDVDGTRLTDFRVEDDKSTLAQRLAILKLRICLRSYKAS